jgi:glucokinase
MPTAGEAVLMGMRFMPRFAQKSRFQIFVRRIPGCMITAQTAEGHA